MRKRGQGLCIFDLACGGRPGLPNSAGIQRNTLGLFDKPGNHSETDMRLVHSPIRDERGTMHIRRATAGDGSTLVDIWLRSVRATHTFLAENDIQDFLPLVQEYLTASGAELWVLCSDAGDIMGFMGMSGSKMESLFLAPEFQRTGGGRRLVRHAQELKGEITVDVNEQNVAACRFYEACGFVGEGRSEFDSTGRPFPLLHLRLVAPRPK